jgi:hypothetical protein
LYVKFDASVPGCCAPFKLLVNCVTRAAALNVCVKVCPAPSV